MIAELQYQDEQITSPKVGFMQKGQLAVFVGGRLSNDIDIENDHAYLYFTKYLREPFLRDFKTFVLIINN